MTWVNRGIEQTELPRRPRNPDRPWGVHTNVAMRWGLSVSLCAMLALLGACEADEPPEAGPAPMHDQLARFSFEEAASLLKDREILLTPLQVDGTVLSSSEFAPLLAKRMDRHPSWKVLSTHLAQVDMPNPHFNIYDQPTYVVEISGPRTGNCSDFYLATDGDYRGSACFYPVRS